MNSARAYPPVAYERPRDPLVVEWLVRVTIGLALFAGFFALGRITAPASSSEAALPARVAVSPSAAVVPRHLSGAFPLERAFQERAAAEREELAQAAAAARARQQAARRTAGARAASANPLAAGPSLTQAPAAQQPSQASAPVTQQAAPPPQPVQRHSGSSGSGGSFESSG
jgi:hypothetical protein